jgi:hypothetical protein
MTESAVVVPISEVGNALQRERREVISVWSVGRLVNNKSSDSFNLIAKVIIGSKKEKMKE